MQVRGKEARFLAETLQMRMTEMRRTLETTTDEDQISDLTNDLLMCEGLLESLQNAG